VVRPLPLPRPRGRHLHRLPLGPIPEGWAVGALGDLATLDRTSIQPARSPEKDFDHFSIPAFDAAQLPTLDRGSTIKSGKFLLSAPAVLVSKLNPRIERTWIAEPRPGCRGVASTEFLILRPKTHLSLEVLYLMVRSETFQEQLRALSGGTSTSHQRAKPDDFLQIRVVCPPVAPCRQISDVVEPQLSMARHLRRSSARLAATRDLLLPKLVTGKIDVSDLDLDAVVASVA
jgi:type I restriction enzyme S subunit